MTIELEKTIEETLYADDEGLKIIKSDVVNGNVYLSQTRTATHTNPVTLVFKKDQAKILITESELEEIMKKANRPFWGISKKKLREVIFGSRK